MQATCHMTGKVFEISEAEESYCRENEIPLPTVCPKERLRNLIVFRNRLYLYHAKCAVTGKKILTCVPTERGFQVVDTDVWFSDAFDAMQYGVDYDFGRSFFEQFYDLFRRVPHAALAVSKPTMLNSDYTNGITAAKNCYLLFAASYNEDCLFSFSMWRNKGCVDCVMCYDCELCYECVNVTKSYHLKFCEDSENCSDSSFLSNCVSCRNCYGCVNLRNKEYCYYNRQMTKEEYEEAVGRIDFGSYRTIEEEKKKFEEFQQTFLVRAMQGRNNQNSTGDFLQNTKNSRDCFIVANTEDLEYCVFLDHAKSSFFHCFFGNNTELVYNSVTVGDDSYSVRFCDDCWMNVSDLEYCSKMKKSSHCFGCTGLKDKQYCIFNQQYSKDDYFELKARIVEQMRQAGEYGQFFPNWMTPFYYNESDASFYFPMEREAAVGMGFEWREEDRLNHDSLDGRITMMNEERAPQVPDSIDVVGDEILERTLVCEKTGKPFKLIKQELDFYRRERLPIPRVAPMERIKGRTAIFEWRELRDERCGKCGEGVRTMVAETGRSLYCERCWGEEVY